MALPIVVDYESFGGARQQILQGGVLQDHSQYGYLPARDIQERQKSLPRLDCLAPSRAGCGKQMLLDKCYGLARIRHSTEQ